MFQLSAGQKRRAQVSSVDDEEESEEELSVKRTRNSRAGKQDAVESEEEEATPRRGRSSVKPTQKVEVNGTSRSRRSKSPIKEVND